jgi:signal peptidase II
MPIEVFGAAAGVLVVDQGIKALVLRRCRLGPCDSHLPAWLRPVFCRGPVFRTVPAPLVLLTWTIAALQIALLTVPGGPLDTSAARWGLGAALGGSAANVLDWGLRGAVVDFIDLQVWPTFNLADVAIVVGLACGLWSLA